MTAGSKTLEDVRELILSAHKGNTLEDKIDFYNSWAENYEQDLVALDYRAPRLAVNRISSHFSGDPETALVLDVACGTGLMAKQMKSNGFRNFVGVDGSEGMMKLAKESRLYQDLKQCMLGHDPLPVQWAGLFDVVVIIGALSVGQVPVSVVRQLCSSTKPGGLICMTTRANRDNLEFKAALEVELQQVEKEGLCSRVEVTQVEEWEKAVSENEHGYIPGAIYLYRKH